MRTFEFWSTFEAEKVPFLIFIVFESPLELSVGTFLFLIFEICTIVFLGINSVPLFPAAKSASVV